MLIRNFFGHLATVCRHRHKVLIHCAKAGILKRGLLHDLSKFSPAEFIPGVKYYQGTRSPNEMEREQNGYSSAWLHHKGRNKHHIEYWIDEECTVQPLMPYEYAVECVCDKLAATRIYLGKNYTSDMPLWHWEKYGKNIAANPSTMKFVTEVFYDVRDYGEGYVLNKKYMKH